MEITKRLSLTKETGEAIASVKHLTGATDGQLAAAIGVAEKDLRDAAAKRAGIGTTQTVARKLAEQLRAQNGQQLAQKKRPAQKAQTIKESATDGRGRDFYGVRREKKNPYSSLGQDAGEKVEGRAERDSFGKRKDKKHTGVF